MNPKREPWEPKVKVGHIPHGVDIDKFYRITDEDGLNEIQRFKSGMDPEGTAEFVLLFNSRNTQRKNIPGIILAFKMFNDMIGQESASKTILVLHTDPVDPSGSDLPAMVTQLAPGVRIVFSSNMLTQEQLNVLYNCSDGVINLSNAEGFGLSTLEALSTERPIIATVTGGLTDQMFVGDEVVSGPWAFPVYPMVVRTIGSIPTPYIQEDIVEVEEACNRIYELYKMPLELRQANGRLGREFIINNGMTSTEMSRRMAIGINSVIDGFVPKKRFAIYKGE